MKSLKIEQLYELKKLFKLLDLRGKDYIYISDVQEVVKKYKFIKLNQNELLFFLSQFSIKDNIDELIRKLFFVLERPHLKTHFIETAYNWAIQQSYEELANDWIKNLF